MDTSVDDHESAFESDNIFIDGNSSSVQSHHPTIRNLGVTIGVDLKSNQNPWKGLIMLQNKIYQGIYEVLR